MKLAAAGCLVAVSSMSIDEVNGQTESDRERPVRLVDGPDPMPGFVSLTPFDFKTKSGCAWVDANGIVHLSVHSNLYYELKIVEKC